MNPDTGEIKEFKLGDLIPEGWIEWKLEDIVEVKGCKFRVIRINCAKNIIELKGVGNTQIK